MPHEIPHGIRLTWQDIGDVAHAAGPLRIPPGLLPISFRGPTAEPIGPPGQISGPDRLPAQNAQRRVMERVLRIPHTERSDPLQILGRVLREDCDSLLHADR